MPIISGGSGGGGVGSVTATDSSITVAGTPTAPTIAVTPAGAGGAIWTVVQAASDQSIATSAVLTNDAELFFASANGSMYEVELFIIYASPAGAGTPDMRIGFGEDANNRGVFLWTGVSTGDAVNVVQAPSDQTQVTGIGGTAAANRTIQAYGAYIAGGATVRFLWGQQTSSSNATVRRAGSLIRYRILP